MMPMARAFAHLLQRSFVVCYTFLGTSPDGIVAQVLTLALTEVPGGYWRLQAWKDSWRGGLRRAIYALGGVWIVVFTGSTVTTIYDDHRAWMSKATIAEQKLRVSQQNANKPQLVPKIVTLMNAPAGDKENSIVGIIGAIDNLGAPGSIADIFISVRLGNGRVIEGKSVAKMRSNETITLGRTPRGKELYLPGSEYWPNKVSEIIPTFGHQTGFLMALIRGVSYEDLISGQNTAILTCTDATGAKTSTEQLITRGTHDVGEIGMEDLQKPLVKR